MSNVKKMTPDGKKINKMYFLDRVARHNDLSYQNVEKVYEAIVQEIYDMTCKGNIVSLTGFGTFYLQKHKGHPVQFEKSGSKSVIDDYFVFKFSASDIINAKIRKQFADKT